MLECSINILSNILVYRVNLAWLESKEHLHHCYMCCEHPKAGLVYELNAVYTHMF